jgi:hypothetical protein
VDHTNPRILTNLLLFPVVGVHQLEIQVFCLVCPIHFGLETKVYTVTFDSWKEFSEHESIAQKLYRKFFAHPYTHLKIKFNKI